MCIFGMVLFLGLHPVSVIESLSVIEICLSWCPTRLCSWTSSFLYLLVTSWSYYPLSWSPLYRFSLDSLNAYIACIKIWWNNTFLKLKSIKPPSLFPFAQTLVKLLSTRDSSVVLGALLALTSLAERYSYNIRSTIIPNCIRTMGLSNNPTSHLVKNAKRGSESCLLCSIF